MKESEHPIQELEKLEGFHNGESGVETAIEPAQHIHLKTKILLFVRCWCCLVD